VAPQDEPTPANDNNDDDDDDDPKESIDSILQKKVQRKIGNN